jgi:hypothetical protein
MGEYVIEVKSCKNLTHSYTLQFVWRATQIVCTALFIIKRIINGLKEAVLMTCTFSRQCMPPHSRHLVALPTRLACL